MSLYQCIDRIEGSINRINQKGKDANLKKGDLDFLNQLKSNLSNIIESNDYTNLNDKIELIENYLKDNPHASKPPGFMSEPGVLDIILLDLKTIQKNMEASSEPKDKSSETYLKFQKEEYKIAELNQGKMFELGMSPGECYGFTFSMVDPELSPYQNKDVKTGLNQTIHDFQKNQKDREKDQGRIKRGRLTRRYFEPSARKQAEKIHDFADKHLDKDLMLIRRGAVGGHACYVRKQEDGAIRYMDPNHGAYLFENKDDFIDCVLSRR